MWLSGLQKRLVQEDVCDSNPCPLAGLTALALTGGTPRCEKAFQDVRRCSHHAQRAVLPREDAAPHSESIGGVVADHGPARGQ